MSWLRGEDIHFLRHHRITRSPPTLERRPAPLAHQRPMSSSVRPSGLRGLEGDGTFFHRLAAHCHK